MYLYFGKEKQEPGYPSDATKPLLFLLSNFVLLYSTSMITTLLYPTINWWLFSADLGGPSYCFRFASEFATQRNHNSLWIIKRFKGNGDTCFFFINGGKGESRMTSSIESPCASPPHETRSSESDARSDVTDGFDLRFVLITLIGFDCPDWFRLPWLVSIALIGLHCPDWIRLPWFV